MRISMVLAGLMTSAILVGPALAETVSYKADLEAKSEVPPTGTDGKGSLTATYDTASKTLTYKVDYSGLSGPATMAHFHGPAPVGKNAGVAVPITGSVASPIEGKATLTDAQAKALADGEMYFNIHTDAHKSGEIRGQVEKGSQDEADVITARIKAAGGWIDVSFEGDVVTMAAVSPSLQFLVKEPANTAQRQKRTDERGRYRRMAIDALRSAGAGDDLDEAEIVWTYRAG